MYDFCTLVVLTKHVHTWNGTLNHTVITHLTHTHDTLYIHDSIRGLMTIEIKSNRIESIESKSIVTDNVYVHIILISIVDISMLLSTFEQTLKMSIDSFLDGSVRFGSVRFDSIRSIRFVSNGGSIRIRTKLYFWFFTPLNTSRAHEIYTQSHSITHTHTHTLHTYIHEEIRTETIRNQIESNRINWIESIELDNVYVHNFLNYISYQECRCSPPPPRRVILLKCRKIEFVSRRFGSVRFGSIRFDSSIRFVRDRYTIQNTDHVWRT